jgi:non-homologous end joining protein Ku
VEEKGKVVNLMDALEKSLSEAKAKKKEKAG